MSTDSVEELHLRLRLEIDRLGYSLAAASRAIGDSEPQNLKDVVSGRKRCPADLVGRLATIGVDISYVLTGVRQVDAGHLTEREAKVIDNYRSLPEEDRAAVQRLTNALAESAGRYVVDEKKSV